MVSHAHSVSFPDTKPAEEKQHAICRITSDLVNATANATLTRKLEGVCTSDELHIKLNALEENLTRLITNLQTALYGDGASYEKMHKNLYPKRESRDYEYYIYNALNPMSLDRRVQGSQTNLYREGSSLGVRNFDSQDKDVRELEASKFNLTFQDSNMGLSFVYFWRIDGINETLNSYENVIFSSSFHLYGHELFIKLFPNHFGTKYIAFELVQSIPRKHRFSILNFKNYQKDLSSQILLDRHNYATTYRVSHKKILNGDYIKNGSLFVKLTIFIDY
ncbi:uncharacterized protein LOC112903899 [Agrilus planipennis]|uniref:Uncharacterized protein LOC112903899 n=1 Tax=Agrilus planipennis TaxID=224129 RepID=A0A7F5RA47_AGRPL|nr:uncharacterized protein LOC112903899 [Agrilus planipennis]